MTKCACTLGQSAIWSQQQHWHCKLHCECCCLGRRKQLNTSDTNDVRSGEFNFVVYNMAENRQRRIFILWTDITEIIGPARLWPYMIRRLFWTPNLNHFQRVLVCTFVCVNGLNPVIFEEWASLINLCRDESARRHISSFFKYFLEGRYYNLYGFNVTMGFYEYLDGSIHHYKGKR